MEQQPTVSFTLQLSQSGESEVPVLWLSYLNIESWSSNLQYETPVSLLAGKMTVLNTWY